MAGLAYALTTAVLPLPLMIGWFDIPIGLIQLAVVGIVAMYDRRTLGRVHPATKAIAAIVIAVRLTISKRTVDNHDCASNDCASNYHCSEWPRECHL